MRYLLVFFVATLGIASAAISTKTKKNETIFVPTKEWQKVEKGTPIPAGLYIRHNLQTGKTEAKLLDEDEENEKSENNVNSLQQSLTLHPEKALKVEENKLPKTEEPNDEGKISYEELKAMLKKIKSDDSDTLLKSKNTEPVEPEKTKKFRSYNELKEELDAVNVNISTDTEVLINLFSQFELYKEFIKGQSIGLSKIENVLDILNNLEYLIHQIDNAQMFTDLGGMSKIISPSLNSTNSKIKSEALRLLGAAAQSNPKVQLKALENYFVQKLLHMLTIHNRIDVKSRCLFALGALVRHFPAAQKVLVNNGGLEIFGKILIDGHFQIQIRVMNLINDLTIERQNLMEIQDEQQRIKRTKEYQSTDFESMLVKQNYCLNLLDLMLRTMKYNSEIDDFHEVVYESMITLGYICKNEFMSHKQTLLLQIEAMLIRFQEFPRINEEGEDLNAPHEELLRNLVNILREEQHDEL